MITKDDIEAAERKVRIAKEDLQQLRSDYAIQECPLSIGQEVTITGYSQTGKTIIVDRIEPPTWSFRGSWEATGWINKADGTPGKVRAYVSQEDWERNNG